MSLSRALAAALALAAAPAARAGDPLAEAALAPRHRVLLLLRTVLYDRNASARLGERAELAILFRPGDPASEADRDAMRAAVEGAAGEVLVAGRRVQARLVAWDGAEPLAAALRAGRPAALYACAGLEGQAAEVARATRGARVLSAGGSRAMAEAGLSIALVHRGARAGLVVNLEAARAEGADLDAALLAVAEVLGHPAGPR